MGTALIGFLLLALCVVAALVPVAAHVAYRRGVVDGRILQADVEDRKRLQAPPAPYVCPHVWEPWSKPKWVITPGGNPLSGWGRMQRRQCGPCGEEQERIV